VLQNIIFSDIYQNRFICLILKNFTQDNNSSSADIVSLINTEKTFDKHMNIILQFNNLKTNELSIVCLALVEHMNTFKKLRNFTFPQS